MKTHNDKNFKALVDKGVAVAFWTHYVQMQVYMHKKGLRFALYIAINKNDDEIYVEIIVYSRDVALANLSKGLHVIQSQTPPARIPRASLGWYKCKICDFSDVCLKGKPLEKNCRTCIYAQPVEGGWHCAGWQIPLSDEVQRVGCDAHTPIDNR